MNERPGTVSNILWHFTGGPRWNQRDHRQEDCAKPSADAYAALIAIVRSGFIRLASYEEFVRAEVEHVKRDEATNQRIYTTRPVEIRTTPVNCVADIPLMHLGFHARRYGKFAIGFRRRTLIDAGFNPVLYTLENRSLSATLHHAIGSVESAKSELEDIRLEVEVFADGIQTEVEGLEDSDGEAIEHSIDFSPFYVDNEIDDVDNRLANSVEHLADVLAFVKTFREDQFETVYCEREWRSKSEFRFAPADVAMIVIPREQDGIPYFANLLADPVSRRLPREVPICAWEDIVEQ